MLEDPVDLDERAPEPVCGGAIIGRVRVILREGNRIGHLVRHRVDRDRNAETGEARDEPLVEFRHGLRLEGKGPFFAPAGAHDELVAELAAKDDWHAAALSDLSAVRVAVDQTLAGFEAPLADVREVAFFPPMTGG